MNLFKFSVMPLCILFCFISILSAQSTVTDENEFVAAFSTSSANIEIIVSSPISFANDIPSTAGKNIDITLNSGVSLNGTGGGSAANGFIFESSNVLFTLDGANVISGFSGAFTATNTTSLSFDGGDIIFRQNSADSDSAVFNVSGGSVSINTDKILFSLNESGGSGGAASLDASSFEITASTVLFRNNSSSDNAGSIYALNGSAVNLQGDYIEFYGNKSGHYGGAVYGSGGSHFNFAADVLMFDHNGSLSGSGGVAYAANAVFDFDGVSAYFYHNYSFDKGGAFFANDGSVFTFGASTSAFAGNEAGNDGGVIYSESGSKFEFNGDETYFDNNKALLRGGAIAAAGGSEITFASLNTFFNYNEAESGGAVYADSSTFIFSGDSVLFAGNKADSGGALYAVNGAVFNFSAEDTVFRHNKAANGGAVYMSGSSISIEDAQFLNNSASALGGFAYMNGASASETADLTIKALGKDILFSGNTDVSGANDIYMNQYGNLEFYADSGRKITLEGGIAAKADADNYIVKTGNGTLEFSGNFSGYKGGLTISSGTLSVLNDVAVSAGNFEVLSGAEYSTVNNQANQTTTVGSAQINGELSIDIDFASYKADKIISASGITAASDGKVNLDNTSILTISDVNALGLGTNSIVIIEAENGVTGTFSSDNADAFLALFGQAASVSLNYLSNSVELYVSRLSSFYTLSGMTHNQREVALSLDEISKADTSAGMSALMTIIDNMADDSLKKAAFDRIAGSFIANAVTAGTFRSGIAELYARIQPRYCQRKSKISESNWGQIYLTGNKYDRDINSPDSFTSGGYGVQVGYDLLTGKNSVGGLYVSYGHNTLEQGSDEADMKDYGIGLYGGWFGEIADIKGSLNGGIQSFDLKRNIEFAGLKTGSEFNTYGVRADGQIEFKTGIGGETAELRPFIGFRGGYVVSGEIKEKGGGAANLIIESGDYLRVEGLGGVGIGNRSEKFNWYAKVYAGYLITGTQNEFSGKFADNGQKMNIRGSELDALGGGAGIGAEYNLTKQWSLYANADAGVSDGSSGYYGNIGVNYAFCVDRVRNYNREKKEKLSEPAKKKEYREPETGNDIVEERYVALENDETLSSTEDSIAADEPFRLQAYGMPEEKEDTAVTAKEYSAEEKEATEGEAKPVPSVYRQQEPETMEEKKDEVMAAQDETIAGTNRPVYEKAEIKEAASFTADDHGLNIDEKEKIKRQAQEIKTKGYNKIVVRGHTDSTGGDGVNNILSLQRAKAVYEEFIANGIDPDKIEYVGYADRNPVASNATQEGRGLNRRTDIVIDGPAIEPGVIYTASYFITDGYSLPDAVRKKVKEQSDEIRRIDYNEIIIEGHADSTGNDAINDPLSERRAKTVYDEFVRNGIPAEKMNYAGYGSKRPIDTNATREGRTNNRRVDVIVK